MSTAFGILLFVLVYGRVAYFVYADVTRRSRARPRRARSSWQRSVRRLELRTP